MRLLKRFGLVLPGGVAAGLVAGCAIVAQPPDFRIVNASGDRQNGPAFLLSENNRVTRRPGEGGVHLQRQGVYLNPALIGQGLYLILLNAADAHAGRDEHYALGAVHQVHVVADGQSFTLLPREQDSEMRAYRDSFIHPHKAREYKLESASLPLSPGELDRMIAAESLGFYIKGSQRDVAIPALEVSTRFRGNLARFRTQVNDLMKARGERSDLMLGSADARTAPLFPARPTTD